MKQRRFTSAFYLMILLFTGGCGVENHANSDQPNQAHVNDDRAINAPYEFNEPATVWVGFKGAQPNVGGSGTLIADGWVITAKHVVKWWSTTSTIWVSPDVFPMAQDGIQSELNRVYVKRVIHHPDPNVDISLLELEHSINGVTPVAIIPVDISVPCQYPAPEGFKRRIKILEDVKVVGYGCTQQGTTVGKGEKRSLVLSAWSCSYVNQYMTLFTKMGGGGACNGDSGGSSYVDYQGQKYLIGTTIFGGASGNTTPIYLYDYRCWVQSEISGELCSDMIDSKPKQSPQE